MSQDGNEYFCLMFVRKKKNRSGTTTVVVVEKRAGRHVYVCSIGSSILLTSSHISVINLQHSHTKYFVYFAYPVLGYASCFFTIFVACL